MVKILVERKREIVSRTYKISRKVTLQLSSSSRMFDNNPQGMLARSSEGRPYRHRQLVARSMEWIFQGTNDGKRDKVALSRGILVLNIERRMFGLGIEPNGERSPL